VSVRAGAPPYFPVPVKGTVCGLLLALSLTFIMAVRPSGAPGVSRRKYSSGQRSHLGSSRERDGADRQSGREVIGQRRVVSGAGGPHFQCLKRQGRTGEAFVCTMPVPVNVAFCGVLDALSFTLRVPLSAPRALGVNVTLMVQVPFAATPPLQVSVSV
jgi:hypothetical protein